MLGSLLATLASLVAAFAPPAAPPAAPTPPPKPAQPVPVLPVSPPPVPVSAPPVTPTHSVESTAYCLTGRMASGRRTYIGAVASNRHPLGTRVWLEDSPWGPGEFVVEDRIGWGTQLDFAMPGDCWGARRWGRRRVALAEVT